MTSTNTYTDQSYVVYHITYSGDKLPSKNNSNITPSNYIGSTSIKQINKGYMGSVKSKKYKVLWELELKQNPHLFKLEIISYHDTRSDATYKELQVQQIFNVVKNPLFVNMAYATVNGYFGMDNTGAKQSQKTIAKRVAYLIGIPRSDNTKEKISIAKRGVKIGPNKIKRTAESKAKQSALMKGRTPSKEAREKQSLALTGRPQTTEHIENMAESKRKWYICINSDKIEHLTKNLKQFCKDNNLCYSCMLGLTNKSKTKKPHKGWTCTKPQTNPLNIIF